MDGASIGLFMRRQKRRHRPEGFSPLEMMMVVTVILIVASVATPIYMTCALRAREPVLRDDLYTLRGLIDCFTLDNGRAISVASPLCRRRAQGLGTNLSAMMHDFITAHRFLAYLAGASFFAGSGYLQSRIFPKSPGARLR
jgi:Tfp pilus assembly protein PilE